MTLISLLLGSSSPRDSSLKLALAHADHQSSNNAHEEEDCLVEEPLIHQGSCLLALGAAIDRLYCPHCYVNTCEVVQLKQETNDTTLIILVVGEESFVKFTKSLEGVEHKHHPEDKFVVLSCARHDLFPSFH